MLLCLVVAGCSSSSSSSATPEPSPSTNSPVVSAHWTFDGLSGALVLDSGSGGHHGEVVDATLDPNGRLNAALSFDGAASRVSVDADALELIRWDAITIALWARPTAPGAAALAAYGSSSSSGFALAQTSSNSARFEMNGKGSVEGGSLTLDRWVHVAATYDGSSLRLFLDGEEVERLDGLSGDVPPALTDFVLGNRADGSAGFIGLIDDLQLYSHALTPSEIRALYDAVAPEPIVASDVSVETIRETPVSIELEFSSPDLALVTSQIVIAPANGTASVDSAGPGAPWTVTYTPDAGYLGPDNFTYRGNIDAHLSNDAVVTIDVTRPPARGRVQIVDNHVVTDTGEALRGETITLADWNLGVLRDPHHWLELRDDFRLNAIRLLVSRPPQLFGGGPGAACFPPAYTCYELDYLVDGESTTLQIMDEAVELARVLGMYIVVDYHSLGGYDEADAIDWWGEIAPRYADETHVLYEVANEPVQWAPVDYTADDVAFQESMHAQLLALAPDTHQILWTFSHLALGMKEKVDEGVSIDYSNASVGFHPYGVYDLDAAAEIVFFYPAIQTEISGSFGPGSYHETLLTRTSDHESLGFSWFWLNGAKTTSGPGSITDGIMTSEVTWSADPGTSSLDDTAPPAPGTPSGGALAWNLVELQWSAPHDPETGVVFYRVYRDGVLVGEPSRPEYLDNSTPPSQTLAYTVAAVNGTGLESPVSGSVLIVTPEAPPNPLSLHWPLDAGSGVLAFDATALAQNGLITTPLWVDVVGETAIYLDGSTSYVSLADAFIFAPVPGHSSLPGVDFTLSCSVQRFGLGQLPIVVKQGALESGPQYGFALSVHDSGALEFSVSRDDTPTGTSTVISSTTLSVGTWYDVAATYRFLGDGASELRVFVDGVPVGLLSSGVGPVQSNSQPLEMGRLWWAPGDVSYFVGVLDDLRIHNVILSDTEIADLSD